MTFVSRLRIAATLIMALALGLATAAGWLPGVLPANRGQSRLKPVRRGKARLLAVGRQCHEK